MPRIEELFAAIAAYAPESVKVLNEHGRTYEHRRVKADPLGGLKMPTTRSLAAAVLATKKQISLDEAFNIKHERDWIGGQLKTFFDDTGLTLDENPENLLHDLFMGLTGRQGPGNLEIAVDVIDELIAKFKHGFEAAEWDQLRAESDYRNYCERRDSRLDTDVSRLLNHVADAVDVAPPNYPAHLSPAQLAVPLHARILTDSDVANYVGINGLYAGPQFGASAPQPIRTIFDEHRLVVLLGDPGGGKSTALAAEFIRRVRNREICLIARLSDVAEASVASADTDPSAAAVARRIAAAVTRGFGRYAVTRGTTLEAHIERMLIDNLTDPTATNTTVLLDGLDEVPAGLRNPALDILANIADRLKGRVLVGTRVAGYSPFATSSIESASDTWTQAGLTPLDHSTVIEIVNTWHEPGSPAHRRAEEAVTSAPLRELARVPVVTGMVCVVAANEHVASTRQGLYRQYIENLLARPRNVNEAPPTATELVLLSETARAVAWRMATGSDGYRRHAWADETTIGYFESRTRGELLGRIADFITQRGLMVPYGLPEAVGTGQHYRWLHRTIHEYLVGAELASRLIDESAAPATHELLPDIALRTQGWPEALYHCFAILGRLDAHQPALETLWCDLEDHGDIGGELFYSIVWYGEASGWSYRFDDLLPRAIEEFPYVMVHARSDGAQLLIDHLVEQISEDPIPTRDFEQIARAVVRDGENYALSEEAASKLRESRSADVSAIYYKWRAGSVGKLAAAEEMLTNFSERGMLDWYEPSNLGIESDTLARRIIGHIAALVQRGGDANYLTACSLIWSMAHSLNDVEFAVEDLHHRVGDPWATVWSARVRWLTSGSPETRGNFGEHLRAALTPTQLREALTDPLYPPMLAAEIAHVLPLLDFPSPAELSVPALCALLARREQPVATVVPQADNPWSVDRVRETFEKLTYTTLTSLDWEGRLAIATELNSALDWIAEQRRPISLLPDLARLEMNWQSFVGLTSSPTPIPGIMVWLLDETDPSPQNAWEVNDFLDAAPHLPIHEDMWFSLFHKLTRAVSASPDAVESELCQLLDRVTEFSEIIRASYEAGPMVDVRELRLRDQAAVFSILQKIADVVHSVGMGPVRDSLSDLALDLAKSIDAVPELRQLIRAIEGQ